MIESNPVVFHIPLFISVSITDDKKDRGNDDGINNDVNTHIYPVNNEDYYLSISSNFADISECKGPYLRKKLKA